MKVLPRITPLLSRNHRSPQAHNRLRAGSNADISSFQYWGKFETIPFASSTPEGLLATLRADLAGSPRPQRSPEESHRRFLRSGGISPPVGEGPFQVIPARHHDLAYTAMAFHGDCFVPTVRDLRETRESDLEAYTVIVERFRRAYTNLHLSLLTLFFPAMHEDFDFRVAGPCDLPEIDAPKFTKEFFQQMTTTEQYLFAKLMQLEKLDTHDAMLCTMLPFVLRMALGRNTIGFENSNLWFYREVLPNRCWPVLNRRQAFGGRSSGHTTEIVKIIAPSYSKAGFYCHPKGLTNITPQETEMMCAPLLRHLPGQIRLFRRCKDLETKDVLFLGQVVPSSERLRIIAEREAAIAPFPILASRDSRHIHLVWGEVVEEHREGIIISHPRWIPDASVPEGGAPTDEILFQDLSARDRPSIDLFRRDSAANLEIYLNASADATLRNADMLEVAVARRVRIFAVTRAFTGRLGVSYVVAHSVVLSSIDPYFIPPVVIEKIALMAKSTDEKDKARALALLKNLACENRFAAFALERQGGRVVIAEDRLNIFAQMMHKMDDFFRNRIELPKDGKLTADMGDQLGFSIVASFVKACETEVKINAKKKEEITHATTASLDNEIGEIPFLVSVARDDYLHLARELGIADEATLEMLTACTTLSETPRLAEDNGVAMVREYYRNLDGFHAPPPIRSPYYLRLAGEYSGLALARHALREGWFTVDDHQRLRPTVSGLHAMGMAQPMHRLQEPAVLTRLPNLERSIFYPFSGHVLTNPVPWQERLAEFSPANDGIVLLTVPGEGRILSDYVSIHPRRADSPTESLFYVEGDRVTVFPLPALHAGLALKPENRCSPDIPLSLLRGLAGNLPEGGKDDLYNFQTRFHAGLLIESGTPPQIEKNLRLICEDIGPVLGNYPFDRVYRVTVGADDKGRRFEVERQSLRLMNFSELDSANFSSSKERYDLATEIICRLPPSAGVGTRVHALARAARFQAAIADTHKRNPKLLLQAMDRSREAWGAELLDLRQKIVSQVFRLEMATAIAAQTLRSVTPGEEGERPGFDKAFLNSVRAHKADHPITVEEIANCVVHALEGEDKTVYGHNGARSTLMTDTLLTRHNTAKAGIFSFRRTVSGIAVLYVYTHGLLSLYDATTGHPLEDVLTEKRRNIVALEERYGVPLETFVPLGRLDSREIDDRLATIQALLSGTREFFTLIDGKAEEVERYRLRRAVLEAYVAYCHPGWEALQENEELVVERSDIARLEASFQTFLLAEFRDLLQRRGSEGFIGYIENVWLPYCRSRTFAEKYRAAPNGEVLAHQVRTDLRAIQTTGDEILLNLDARAKMLEIEPDVLSSMPLQTPQTLLDFLTYHGRVEGYDVPPTISLKVAAEPRREEAQPTPMPVEFPRHYAASARILGNFGEPVVTQLTHALHEQWHLAGGQEKSLGDRRRYFLDLLVDEFARLQTDMQSIEGGFERGSTWDVSKIFLIDEPKEMPERIETERGFLFWHRGARHSTVLIDLFLRPRRYELRHIIYPQSLHLNGYFGPSLQDALAKRRRLQDDFSFRFEEGRRIRSKGPDHFNFTLAGHFNDHHRVEAVSGADFSQGSDAFSLEILEPLRLRLLDLAETQRPV